MTNLWVDANVLLRLITNDPLDLAELTGSVCHLHVHTEQLPELIEDEILALPDESDSD